MQKQRYIVKIKDGNCNHEPSFFPDTDNIRFLKNTSPNSNGDIVVDKGDVVIYTNLFQNRIDTNARKNIALMMEGHEIHRTYYDYIRTNNKKFDLILTFDKTLLDRGENFKLNLYGTSWVHDSYINIWNKSELCSMITSNKSITSGHRFRHIITDYLTRMGKDIYINIYGGRYMNLPYMKTKAFDIDHNCRHISNGKINALKLYMFSIVIENSKEDYMFTEKLIDCFLTGTVPIYYGCPSIHKFFNIKGILIIDTLSDLESILPKLNRKMYDDMMPYVTENFEMAQKYKTFTWNEEAILDVIK